MLSEIMNRVSESETMRMAAAAINLRSRGIEVINLGVGEPDFNTPEHIKNAAREALDRNLTHYTLSRGVEELREAISGWLKKEFNVEYSADELIVSNGAKQAIFNAFLALISPGDEVLIPTPCWPTYIELTHIIGAKPVLLETGLSDHFKITPEQLSKAITPHTKAFILSNPSNPTGMTYQKNEIAALVDVLKDSDVYIFSDEIYGKLIYGKCCFESAGVYRDSLNDKVVLFQGVSKAYAMTGWRLGFAAASKDVIKACDVLQGHSTSNVSTISQYAALAAFNGPREDVQNMRQKFDERRKYVYNYLKTIPDLQFIEPDGAFYFFPKIDKFYGTARDGSKITNSTELALYLLNNAYVSVIPGKGFASEHYLRLSYATGMDQLQKGLEALKEGLLKIQRA